LNKSNQLASVGSTGARLCLDLKRRETDTLSPAETAEAVRVRRLREDARRPLSVNLAEGIALSHKLMRFTGAARSN
jgi:hypothetical protein